MQSTYTLVVVTTLLWLSAPLAFAQDDSVWNEVNCDALRKYLNELHAENQFNGTVLIAENGKIKLHESIGYSNMENQMPLDDQASFRLASVSKQFTCMGIMLLKKEGKLNYDDKVVKHIEGFPYSDITIRHLMHHTSGLPDYMFLMNSKWDPGKSSNKRKIAFNKDMIKIFVEHKPKLLFKPGEKFKYSNTGYVVLGYLVESISKMPVQKYMEESIFKPLKMNRSHIFSNDDRFDPHHRVYGFTYTDTQKGFKPNDYHYLNGMIGDGGVYCSALDLLKWDQALYGETLLPKEMLDEAFESGELNDGNKTGYGFGWGVARNGDKFQVSHSGGWVGFITFIGRNITEKSTLIILTNHSSRHMNKIRDKISELKKAAIKK